MTGLVRNFDDRRGFGFITPLIGKPDEVQDLFFHVSSCGKDGAPTIGCQVEFVLVRGRKGPQAARVRLVRLPARALTRSNGGGA